MRSDRERLEDILERCELLRKHVSQTEKLDSDPLARAGALYWILILGEAAANISPELRLRYPEVPWSDAIGMRNVLVHGYFGADVEIVRQVIDRDIPVLERQIRAILDELD